MNDGLVLGGVSQTLVKGYKESIADIVLDNGGVNGLVTKYRKEVIEGLPRGE